MKTLQVLMEGMFHLQKFLLHLGKLLGAALDLGAEGQEALQNLNIKSYFLTIFKILLDVTCSSRVVSGLSSQSLSGFCDRSVSSEDDVYFLILAKIDISIR